MTTDHPTLLTVDDLTVGFGAGDEAFRAVDSLSFSVDAGETLAILGESGSGKSVTSRAIMGLLPRRAARIESGRISFDGTDLLSLPARRARAYNGRDMAMIFQEPLTSLNPVMRVGWQISEVARRRGGMNRSDARQLAISLLDRVGIPDPATRVDAFPHELSGGMRQRAMIATAIAMKPRLLIADEPTTALDVTVQKQIMGLLAELRDEYGMALILVSHDLGVVANIADRALIMYAGRSVESGRVRTVYDQSAHPYTLALLRSLPTGDGGARLHPIPGSPPDPRALPSGCAFRNRCDFATELCSERTPEIRRVETGHAAACHHAADIVTREGLLHEPA